MRAIAKYKVLRAIVKYDMDGRKIEPLLTSNNGGLEYSSREPAVNVYTTGGQFLAHERMIKSSQFLSFLVAIMILK